MIRSLALALLVAGCADRPLPLARTCQGHGLAAACETESACHLFPALYRAADCLQAWRNLDDPITAAHAFVNPAIADCLACAGPDCDAARRCLNGGEAPQPCLDRAPRCRGDLLFTCIDGETADREPGIVQFDCATVGLQCRQNATAADCANGECAAGESDNHCVGDVLVGCHDGLSFGHLDCRASGGVCLAIAGVAHCAPKP